MTDPKFTTEEISKLYEPFQPDEHEVRKGFTGKNNQQYWFVYVTRTAIQKRLDMLFPGEWSSEIVGSPQRYEDGTVTVTVCITIRGVSRCYNGSDKNGKDFENTEKAAFTDAFKRAASMWGIGLYLQDAPQIKTPAEGYQDQNALNLAKRWIQSGFKHDVLTGEVNTAPETAVNYADPSPSPVQQHANGQLFDEHGTLPDDKHPDIETTVDSAVVVEHIVKGKPQKYIKCQTEAGMTVVAFTRSRFTDKGYAEAEDWTEVNQQYTPKLPIPVTLHYTPMEQMYQLADVHPVGVSDDPKAEAPKQGARFKAGA